MKLFILIQVAFMTIPGFAKVNQWEDFNSCLLIEVTRPTGVFTCTGVAVSNNTLVTAAHCLEGDIKKVRVFTQSHYDPKLKSLPILDYKIHPSYNSKKSRFKSDIAKIHMKAPLPKFINEHKIYRGTIITGTLYRFGFGERNKKNLRTVITPSYRRLNLADGIIELNDEFSMSGDSGGPIYLKNGNDITILAIHSTFSHGPEGNFSMNPLLGSYVDWIFEH